MTVKSHLHATPLERWTPAIPRASACCCSPCAPMAGSADYCARTTRPHVQTGVVQESFAVPILAANTFESIGRKNPRQSNDDVKHPGRSSTRGFHASPLSFAIAYGGMPRSTGDRIFLKIALADSGFLPAATWAEAARVISFAQRPPLLIDHNNRCPKDRQRNESQRPSCVHCNFTFPRSKFSCFRVLEVNACPQA
jgi:hypothetical protein